MADHLVKLIHARDLARWDRFPAYEAHSARTLAEHRAEVNARKDLGSQIWQLLEARRLVDGAGDPKAYRTATVRSPWPISLPGRRSVRLSSPDHPGTTFASDVGQVEGGRLVLPLFIKERWVQVRYLAPDRVAAPDKLAKAEAQLVHASKSDLERLRTYLGMREPDPVLFISHRWKSPAHPDPDGRQLEKLKALKDCYVIYDYASFPQDNTTPEARRALRQVLDAMNGFIDNLLVLSDPGYMTRGWCLYEYIVGSLTHRIVGDEINDPALVRLRNLIATKPNPPGIGSTHREAVNAKSELVREAVNAVLPVFGRGEFTVPADQTIVRNLLIERLRSALPPKQEYVPYVGEWKTIQWTEEELAAAFAGELKWEALQYDPTIPIFQPAVPDTVAGANATGFLIQKQPADFGQERYNFDLDIRGLVLKTAAGACVVVLLLLWGLYRIVRWIFT